jgi:RNA polymerase sigma-70 factor, ECF subfamily
MTAVAPMPFPSDAATLVRALRAGHPRAATAFYDEHARHVLETLRLLLGADEDIQDLLQEVFIRGFNGIGKLREAERVRGWLTKIAILVAAEQRRLWARRNRLRVLSPEHTHPTHCEQPPLDVRRSVYQLCDVVDALPAKERDAFTLRYVEGMTLRAAALACGTSLATFKRRLARAERRFLHFARRRPGMEDWLTLGAKWTARRMGSC